MSADAGDVGDFLQRLNKLPERLAEELEREVKGMKIVYDVRDVRRARRRPVPAWCRNPLLRGFVMGSALAAPLLLIAWAWLG